MIELSPADLKARPESGQALVLLDVREAEELALARLEGSVHIPMGEIPGRLHELDRTADIVVYCHQDIRSTDVAAFLVQHGFACVANLAGGIDAWSLGVDSTVPRHY